VCKTLVVVAEHVCKSAILRCQAKCHSSNWEQLCPAILQTIADRAVDRIRLFVMQHRARLVGDHASRVPMSLQASRHFRQRCGSGWSAPCVERRLLQCGKDVCESASASVIENRLRHLLRACLLIRPLIGDRDGRRAAVAPMTGDRAGQEASTSGETGGVQSLGLMCAQCGLRAHCIHPRLRPAAWCHCASYLWDCFSGGCQRSEFMVPTSKDTPHTPPR
jgi:hypothetical protein